MMNASKEKYDCEAESHDRGCSERLLDGRKIKECGWAVLGP